MSALSPYSGEPTKKGSRGVRIFFSFRDIDLSKLPRVSRLPWALLLKRKFLDTFAWFRRVGECGRRNIHISDIFRCDSVKAKWRFKSLCSAGQGGRASGSVYPAARSENQSMNPIQGADRRQHQTTSIYSTSHPAATILSRNVRTASRIHVGPPLG
jgi:hypothetical protein